MENILEVKNVCKSFYQGSKEIEVLNDINLTVKKNTLISIQGASGTGKSTLMHIMGVLEKPTSGGIVFDGVSMTDKSDKELAVWRNEKIGFIFQFHNLLPEFSALENVMLPGMINDAWKDKGGRQSIRDKAESLLREVGLEDRMNHHPSILSGGEQQRVAIARALINDPVLLLADEPTGNLDRKTGEVVYELLIHLSRSRSKAFIVVTHDEELVNKSDCLFHLKDGGLS